MFLILRTFLFCFFILMEEFSTQDLNLEETGTSTQLRSIQWIAGADSDLETSFQWIVGAGDGFDSSSLQFYGDTDFGGMGGMLFFLSMGWLTISLIYLASKVLTTIVFGKIFEKAKIAWWWALIPLANTYVFLKMVKLRFLFWLSLFPLSLYAFDSVSCNEWSILSSNSSYLASWIGRNYCWNYLYLYSSI